MKGKVREILYACDDVCRAALAAVDARNTQLLLQMDFSSFKMHCRESLYLCEDITREALAVVDRRNAQYMDDWISASQKRHTSLQKMSVFKNAVGNILEAAYHLNRAVFRATDYNDAAFLHKALNPPEASPEIMHDHDEDNTQCNMNM